MIEQEERFIRFDSALHIEAYKLKGIMQDFPNHFHEHYMLGFMASGRRYLTCKNKDYTIDAGALVLLNPLDNHGCHQVGGMPLDWGCININKDIMRQTVLQITGRDCLPTFTRTVTYHSEAVVLLQELHGMIMEGRVDFEKEEAFYFLIEQLIAHYTEPVQESLAQVSAQIQKACDYMEENFTQLITLDTLSELCGLNKYTLIRNFTKQRGITPYQYLETIRVGAAKKLLEQGIEPIEAAMRTGFVDQSHFTKFYKKLIGLTPRQYADMFNNKEQ